MSQRTKTTQSQAGFTLVELAIVMIIIGLLIGGVLKGQELIGNAQVTATVAQLKSIDAATSTFKDTYAGLPGDIGTAANPPSTRLPNCTVASCNTFGDGNGRLSNAPSATPIGAEGQRFFPQLSAAGLVTGIVPGTDTLGGNYPSAKISGEGITAGSSVDPVANAADFTGVIDAAGISSGLWLAVTNAIGAKSAATIGMKPSEASRIDTKMDDGVPGSGTVRAIGVNSATAGCGTNGAAGLYSTSLAGGLCGLYVRIQS